MYCQARQSYNCFENFQHETYVLDHEPGKIIMHGTCLTINIFLVCNVKSDRSWIVSRVGGLFR